MDKYSLPVCTEVFSASSDKPAVFEAILPEYCPGIKKILKADAVAAAADASMSGGVINVSIPYDVHLVYIAEGGNIKSVNFSHTSDAVFDASKTAEHQSNSKILTKICIPKVYAKPKSARCAEIKLDIIVSVSACVFDETPLYSPFSSNDIETRCASETVSVRTVLQTEPEEISDSITLESTLPQGSEITDRSLNLYVENTECTDSCIKYKGTGIFKCTYRTASNNESGDGEYIYLKKSIPFEGELLSEKITADSHVILDMSVCALNVTLSADPYGENRIISVNASYKIHAEAFCNKEVEFTHDGFCSLYECRFENTVYTCDVLNDKVNKRESMREEIPINGVNITEITDTELKIGSYSTELNDGKVYALAKAYAVITGSNDNGEPCVIEHRFTVRQCIDENDLSTERKYIICCTSIPEDAVLKDGVLTLDYIFATDGAILEKKHIGAISDAEIFYDRPKPVCRSEYIIYYPDRNETLWDIAKKYEIPKKKIAEANGFDESQSINRKTVLIPCVI